MLRPEATGPLSSLKNMAAEQAGDESGLRFLCHRCRRQRQRTQFFLFGVLAFVVLLVLLLEKLGALP